MKEIGGYLELELMHSGTQLIKMDDIVCLKNGRSSFYITLMEAMPSMVHIPYYLCADVLVVLDHMGVAYNLYEVDDRFDPMIDIDAIGADEMLYVCDYFGLNTSTIRHLSNTLSHRLIIDSSQAFKPSYYHNGSWRFNSLRKYFGVPDGSILVPPSLDYEFSSLPEDGNSMVSLSHLVKRLEYGANAGYEDYLGNETDLGIHPELMSRTSNILLSYIDYDQIRVRREANYYYLHERLGNSNRINDAVLLSGDSRTFKFMYPYLPEKPIERQRLIEHKIYVPQFWPGLITDADQKFGYSQILAKHLIPLPIDQRYGIDDMKYMINVIDGIS